MQCYNSGKIFKGGGYQRQVKKRKKNTSSDAEIVNVCKWYCTTKKRSCNMAAKKELEIPVLKIKMATLHIIGDTPLISHAWDQKSKLMMLGKHQKKSYNS